MGFLDFIYDVPGVRKFRTMLNQLTSYIPPPPVPDLGTKRKVLLVTTHPVLESFSLAIAKVVEDTAKEQGHEVQRIDLGLEQFSPALTAEEHKAYLWDKDKATEESLPKDVRGYIQKLKWCDTLFVVYPTWWMGSPAVLKGFFDRTLRLHHTWDLPKESSSTFLPPPGLIPGLVNIKQVIGISTYGASRPLVFATGDNGRSMISKPIMSILNPDCTILWHGLYDIGFTTQYERHIFLQEVETMVKYRV